MAPLPTVHLTEESICLCCPLPSPFPIVLWLSGGRCRMLGLSRHIRRAELLRQHGAPVAAPRLWWRYRAWGHRCERQCKRKCTNTVRKLGRDCALLVDIDVDKCRTRAGLTIASVPKELRSFASSNATLIYNLLGYFGGPTICGTGCRVAYCLLGYVAAFKCFGRARMSGSRQRSVLKAVLVATRFYTLNLQPK